jgi:hypothetical protein
MDQKFKEWMDKAQPDIIPKMHGEPISIYSSSAGLAMPFVNCLKL